MPVYWKMHTYIYIHYVIAIHCCEQAFLPCPAQELKQQINLILESKAMLEDERNDLLSKLQHVASWEAERASLQGKIEALEVEQEDSSRRVQELLEGNTQLEIERDRK